MSDQNPVYEIAEILSDQKGLQQDFMVSLQQYCKEKYLDKMKQTVSACFESAKSVPCREVRLMNAMKDFMPESRHSNLDQLIHTFTAMQVYNGIRKDLLQSRLDHHTVKTAGVEAASDPCVHSDGIYDVDDACLLQKETHKADAISTLMMMLFLQG